MKRLAATLLRGYERLVPPAEPCCWHGLGVMTCDICRMPGRLQEAGQSVLPKGGVVTE